MPFKLILTAFLEFIFSKFVVFYPQLRPVRLVFELHFHVETELLNVGLDIKLVIFNDFLKFRANLLHFVWEGKFFAFFIPGDNSLR